MPTLAALGYPDLSEGDVVIPVGQCLVLEYTAGGTITKGRAVYISADGTVLMATSAQNCIGIALKAAVSGDRVPILARGRVIVQVGGAIARGQMVYGGDSAGRVLALADQAVNEGGTATYTIYYSRALGRAEQATAGAGEFITLVI